MRRDDNVRAVRSAADVPKDQIFIGSVFAVVCLAVVWRAAWIREHSRFGRGLANWLGETPGLWAIRGIFAALAVFGVLLAVGVISPLRW